MALLSSFSLPFHPDQKIKLTSKSQKNRISVLLGVNGTQKSSILRGLLEDGLFSQPEVEALGARRRGPSCQATWHDSPPARIVAVSSAATDRFPSKAGFGEARILTRYDTAKYAYVGPRTGRNIVSRIQSVQSLLSEFLQAQSLPSSVSHFIEELSSKTSVPPLMSIRLQPRMVGPMMYERVAGASSFQSFLDGPTSASSAVIRSPRLTRFIAEARMQPALMEEAERLFGKLVSKEFRHGIEMEFDLRSPSAPDYRAVHFGLTAGFAGLTNAGMRFGTRDAVEPDAFSAGQWGLFSSLVTVALSVRDRTLLLIDEPENALHPAWQREYLMDLHRAISHSKECHVVLATHSPLIVSSLAAREADLIGLRLNENKSVQAELLEIPVGWQATDVLEDIFDLPSTRAPEVVARIEEAMQLIADGVDKNASKLQRAAKRLLPLLDSLPEDDVARQVIKSICRLGGVKT